jgi:dynamin 1-like protein
VEEFVNSGAAPAERMIRDVIDCEHSYINTDHPSFIGGSRAIAQVCNQ